MPVLGQSMPPFNWSSRRILPGLILLALAVRAGWWAAYVDVIENEGVEYVRLAHNWFGGNGYVSIFGGPHTLFPPFYPLLIGLVTPMTGSGELAARLVSIMMGLVLVWAVYRLGTDAFNPATGAIAGLLAALHPLLVALSASTYSEGTYLALAMAAAAVAVRCALRPEWRAAAGAGVLSGLAYLTRPEGVVLAPLFAALLVAWTWRSGWERALALGVSLGTSALLVAAPYVFWLSGIAGGFRWEGKSALNNIVVSAVNDGGSYEEGSRGLDSAGKPAGAFVLPDQHEALRRQGGEAGGALQVMMRDPAGRILRVVRGAWHAGFLGAPLALLVAVGGFLATKWWRRAPAIVALVCVPPAVTLVALLSIQWLWPRYLFNLLPGLMVWAAAGVERVGSVSRIVAGTLVAALLLLAVRPVLGVGDLNQTRLTDVRAAGTWMGQQTQSSEAQPQGPMIAGIRLALAHYAGGLQVYLPFADEARALTFLRNVAPDFIAVRDSERDVAPYLPAWLDGAVGPCLQPVEDLPEEASARYRIWRWTCRDARD